MSQSDIFDLPDDLPAPKDDGACQHLVGMHLRSVSLLSTAGGAIDLSEQPGRFVLYCYPMTGRPGTPLPDGWDAIPGARGCTPQACAFRDHYQEIKVLNAEVYGLSTQSTDYQLEMVARLHVPFPVLSDEDLAFASALRLPTFAGGSMTLIKRVTLIVNDGAVEKVFYPVFPPHENPDQVIAWLQSAKGPSAGTAER